MPGAQWVSPRIEIFDVCSAGIVQTTPRSHLIPECQPQAIKVRADVSRRWIGLIAFAMQQELCTKNRMQRERRNAAKSLLNRFRVEIAAKALKRGVTTWRRHG